MKKFVSILLALALILSLSVTAFATTLTIADDPAVERTYNGYRLLNLTVSLKSDCGCAEGATHTDNCYNYAYSVNTKYEEILRELATAAGEDDIIEFLAGQTSDSNGTYGSLRDVADDIYRAILETSIAADEPELTATADIAQGYWLFADVTELDAEHEANSLVVVDTKGQNSLTITPKVGLPTIEKKVKDTNDSTGETTDWQDSADYDVGDTVPFKLTATLPENLAGYDSYKIVFHDNLSEGLDLDADSVKVYMFANKDAAAADKDFTDNTPVADFVTSTSELADDCTFEVTCDNILDINGVTKDTVFVVYYEATLNSTADIGLPGNPNEVYLEFSNNPYTDGTGETEPDNVIVFTYQLTINKTDEKGNALKGAGFILYKKNSEGNYVQIGDELKGDNMTTFTWERLDDGYYKLEEKTVPDGYNKMEDIEFTISADHESSPQTLTAGNFATGNFDTGVITKSIENRTGTVLPETGAKGTVMLITCSSMFVMVAAVFMITRKKMSIYED